MKIVQVITRGDDIGGAQVHVRDLSAGLIAMGHEVTVCAGRQGAFTAQLEEQGIPVRVLHHMAREISPWQDLCSIFELAGVLRELKPDLVATHSSKAGWVGRVAARLARRPVLFTAHGWAFTNGVSPRKRRLFQRAEKLAARLSGRIITVSEYDRDLAIRHRVGRPDKLVTIHNGITDVPQRAAPDREGPVRIVMVARFAAPKDQAMAVRALARISGDSKLVFVGDGPTRSEVQQLADSLGLTDRVEFLGARDDVADVLASAHIFLLASQWEGFPLTILEAMRAGLPVVATDVGGVAEAVVPSLTGALVRHGDDDALADALRMLIDNPAIRREWGETGRRRYESRFAFGPMLAKTVALYEEIAVKQRVPLALDPGQRGYETE